MTQSKKVKPALTDSMRRVISQLRTGKVLCVHKKKEVVDLAEEDYSFHSLVANKTYHSLLVAGLIKKTDTRTISDIYTLTDIGRNIEL